MCSVTVAARFGGNRKDSYEHVTCGRSTWRLFSVFRVVLIRMCSVGVCRSGVWPGKINVRVPQPTICNIVYTYLHIFSSQVDIGNGVLVDAGTLARIKADSKGSACRFARSMVRLLFTSEELVGRSLYGRKSNSHKDAAVKDAIDPVRWNAILST